MPRRTVTINSRKYDGTIDKSWHADLISESDDLLTFVGVFDREIRHSHLGIIRSGTVSYEFYWKSKWFNIFRFHEPDGALRNFYCNINTPPVLSAGFLDYTDLDVDFLVWRDLSYQILDLDDFSKNSRIFSYQPMILDRVEAAKSEVETLIRTRGFPFDFAEI